jgi:hypothetical protein
MIETETTLIPLTHSWLGTGTSIKKWWVKLVLWANGYKMSLNV